MIDNKNIQQAWDAFQQYGVASTPISPPVLASWQRSLQHGIDVERNATSLLKEGELHRLKLQHSPFLYASRLAIWEGQERLNDTHSMIILADPQGVILETSGDPRAVDAGQDIRLQNGGRWDEASIGTNAIGTAIMLNAPVQIHAVEHFCNEVKKWTCAAAPVTDPRDQRLLGVVDISGPADTFYPQSLAHAIAIARQVEALLAHEMEVEHEGVLHYYLVKRFSGLNDASIALSRSGKVLYATSRALQELRRRCPRLLDSQNGKLDVGQEEVGVTPTDFVEFIEGVIPGVRCEPVVDQKLLGYILILPNASRAAHPPRSTAPQRFTGFDDIIGESRIMRDTCATAQKMAQSGAPILIEGETGVGKELFARAVHGESQRAGAFVPINCGAMPRELIASELFGHEKGAFTGADRSAAGKIEMANGGTLCLDEIGELPLDMQPYLLRVLEDGIVYRIGSQQEQHVNISLVSMTNRHLANEVEKGGFRQDLFYRIATLHLRVPPLRERGDDVLLIAEALCRALAVQRGCAPMTLSSEAQDCLRHYHWPGNVRELRNVLEMSMLMASGARIESHDLPEDVRTGQKVLSCIDGASRAPHSDLKTAEERLIQEAIERQGGNLTQAAKQLGIARSTLYSRLAKAAQR